jgi:hypothetical protein
VAACRWNSVRRALILLPLLALLLVPAACTTKQGRKLTCQANAVAPQGQPPASTPKAALTWFVTHLAKSQELPTSGYVEEGRNTTRVVYRDASGQNRVSVGNFGTAKKPIWAVENTVSC